MYRLAAPLVCLFVSWPTLAAAEEPIGPEEAIKKVGDMVTVAMEVKSSTLRDGSCFLNSESNFRSSENLTIFINAATVAKFKAADVDDPSTHFRGKMIHVTGTVTLFRERPQIAVDDPDAIKIVEK